MTENQSDRVAAVVWPWREGAQGTAINRGAEKRKALIQFALMLFVAWLLYKFAPHKGMAYVVATLACIVLISGFFIRPVFMAFERFAHAVGKGVGVGLTWGLLVPFFYLCFIPARISHVIKGKDPMKRKFPTDLPTYWEPRPPVRNMDQYRKQH